MVARAPPDSPLVLVALVAAPFVGRAQRCPSRPVRIASLAVGCSRNKRRRCDWWPRRDRRRSGSSAQRRSGDCRCSRRPRPHLPRSATPRDSRDQPAHCSRGQNSERRKRRPWQSISARTEARRPAPCSADRSWEAGRRQDGGRDCSESKPLSLCEIRLMWMDTHTQTELIQSQDAFDVFPAVSLRLRGEPKQASD